MFSSSSGSMKYTKKIIITFLLIGFLILSTGATWLYSKVDGSLPLLNGQKTIFGLIKTATVERDKQGIVTIKAQNRNDIAVATGFVHAQERFFQMDLLRRKSAGELSSLFGSEAINYDLSIRRHRFRDRARQIVNQLPSEQSELIKAYTRGVNQGLRYLKSVPFEYLLLQQEPVHWSEADSILAIFSMYIDLQDHDGERERTLGVMKSALHPDVYAFLNPQGSIWDATLDNSTIIPSPMPTNPWPSTALANRENMRVDTTFPPPFLTNKTHQNEALSGSNNWAISGNISATGSAIVANDIHLNISVPNTWFRASFEYPYQNQTLKITGATLPGTPSMIIGSNGHIAWGFTNSYGDYSDVIELTTNTDESQYLTPHGYVDFTYEKQIIAVKEQPAVELEIKETIWGPVIGTSHQGKLLAYRWVAYDHQAVNLTAMQLETSKHIDQAFNVSARSGIPAQNIIIGDKLGNIGWTIMGPIPKKVGVIGDTPANWSSGKNAWQGYLSPAQYPKIKNPNSNRLWTANSRVIGNEMYEKLGNGGYALGARAKQIKDNLFALKRFDEKALHHIALDDRALFLQRWHNFLLTQVLTNDTLRNNKHFIQAKQVLSKTKQLSASADSVAYRLVRNFRINVRDSVFSQLNKSLKSIEDTYNFNALRHQIETPLWQLVTKRPQNFTMRPESSWQALFNTALTKTITKMRLTNKGTRNQSLSAATWGQQNTSAIKHPLSNAIPFISTWLDMPQHTLSGDSYMPKVQGTDFGASQRMVVSPGHEQTGIFHMPTSQTSHPWSPYYSKGHTDWVQGKPSPFLPGETKYTLTLLSY